MTLRKYGTYLTEFGATNCKQPRVPFGPIRTFDTALSAVLTYSTQLLVKSHTVTRVSTFLLSRAVDMEDVAKVAEDAAEGMT
jgi:hypothetical protein